MKIYYCYNCNKLSRKLQCCDKKTIQTSYKLALSEIFTQYLMPKNTKIYFLFPEVNPSKYEFYTTSKYIGVDLSSKLLYTKGGDEFPSQVILQILGFGISISWNYPYIVDDTY